MVLTLDVIIEESSSATGIGNVVRSRDSYCNRNSEDTHYPDGRNKFCNKLKKAYPWYYILLFVTDVVLVLCFFVTLLLFADWILFIAPVKISLIYGSLLRLPVGRGGVINSPRFCFFFPCRKSAHRSWVTPLCIV